jgi:hypothetical protein
MGFGTLTPGTFSSLSAITDLDLDSLTWQDLAVCHKMDLYRFFEGYESNERIARLTDQVCKSCSVRKQCLSAGVDGQESGCWGGVGLTNGVMDESKNTHKTPDDWKELRELLS